MKLAALFSQLRDRPSGHTYTVAEIPKRRGIWLGIDLTDSPVLFVATQAASQEPPLRASKVSLHVGHRYSLAHIDGTHSVNHLHALHCNSSKASDIETFLLLTEAFVSDRTNDEIDRRALTSFFRSVVRLFSVTPVKDLGAARRGLWGELFVMSRVHGFRFWAPFWHSEPSRRFDFSCGLKRVEVKITTRSERIHHFSHRQIFPIDDEEIVVASIVATEADSGISLRQLIEDCERVLVDTPDYLKLAKAVRQTAMESADESGPILDAAEAAENLAWFRSVDIPHFRVPEPPGVTDTRYKIDLSTAPQLMPVNVDEWLQPWAAERPRLATDG